MLGLWVSVAAIPFHRLLGLIVVVALSCSLFVDARDPASPVRIDESEWITAGYVAFQLLREAAPPARWERAFEELELGDWGNRNPPLGKYIVGAAVMARLPPGSPVDYRASMMEPPELHRLPPPEVLAAARTGIAACGALMLLATYLLALQLLNGSRASLIAPICLFLVPNFQYHATHVYTDVPQLACLLFGSYALLRYARSRRAAWFVLALVCAGLGCAVKLSSGLFCVALVLYAVGEWIRSKTRLWALVAAGVVPCAVFVAVNPYLFERPLEKSIGLVRDWQAIKRAQRTHPQLAVAAVHGLGESLELVSTRGAFAPTSVPHLRSRGPTTRAVLEAGPWMVALTLALLVSLHLRGWRLSLSVSAARPLVLAGGLAAGVLLERALTGKLTWFGGLCGLGLAGLAVELRGPHAAVARAFTLLLATNWLLTILWLPLDWSRYYLPNLSLMTAVYALGLPAVARCFVWTRHAALTRADLREWLRSKPAPQPSLRPSLPRSSTHP